MPSRQVFGPEAQAHGLLPRRFKVQGLGQGVQQRAAAVAPHAKSHTARCVLPDRTLQHVRCGLTEASKTSPGVTKSGSMG